VCPVRAGRLPLRSHRRRPFAGWALLLLAAGCLNPQPDPFPQATGNAPPAADSSRQSTPVDLAPAPQNPSGQTPASATPPPAAGAEAAGAAQPVTPERPTAVAEGSPDAGAAPADAGPDATPPPANEAQ
jgi:hypothetical protein